MQPAGISRVFKKQNKLFTENLKTCKGMKVYNEKLISYKGKEFRSWNPYRSKFAAALLNGLKNINITESSKVLYLGAATGTTVSHISDIVKDGVIYAIENSPVATKHLLELSQKRENIIPLLADANHPDRYSSMVPPVDLIYQDISQRNQAEIFIHNAKRYLKKGGWGIIMVKARSIDVSLKPTKAYELVANKLKEQKLKIVDTINLVPYEKDHAAIAIAL
jgi:fibrillarin-like pre-rRNA processing protein